MAPLGPDPLPATVVMEWQGQMIEVENDVLNIVRQLHELDDGFRVKTNRDGDGFIIYQRTELPDGRVQDELKMTAKKLDQRVVERMRYIDSPHYDFLAEMEKQNAEARKARRDKNRERLEEAHERAFHGARKILGINRRISVPKDPG